MSSRTRILFLAPVEPWCRENGSSLIIADLLDELATHDEVEILPVFMRPPPPGLTRVPEASRRGVLLDIPGVPRWVSVTRAVLSASSPLRHRFDNGRVARAVEDVLAARRFEPSLVHVEHLPLVDIASAVALPRRAPIVYRSHNVESRLWARRLGLPEPAKSMVVKRLERTEADAIRATDLSLWISEGDLDWARDRVPQHPSALFPCSLRLDRYDAVCARRPSFERQICFIGGLDWAPNEAGLRWFVHEVLPRVTAAMPNCGLAVLAREAEQHAWLTDNAAVRILPSEGSAPELFASSHVSISPLFQGGGVRIKIPESLALGCPVVATVVGAEGHDLPGVTRTDDPGAFAAACLRYLAGEEKRPSRADLRASVQARYGAATLATRLVSHWRDALERRSPSESTATDVTA